MQRDITGITKRVGLFTLVCVLALSLVEPAEAATELAPTADAYVVSAYPRTNHGRTSRLLAGRPRIARAVHRFV